MKRKRRSRSAALSADTLRAIKARKRVFLGEVSRLLSEALGFAVSVSMARPKLDLSPDQRRASRLSKAAARRQVRESAGFGVVHPAEPFVFDVVEEPDGSTTYLIPEPSEEPSDEG